MLKKLKKLYTLWCLLDKLDINQEGDITYKTKHALFKLKKTDLEIQVTSNLRLNASYILNNCDPDFDPVEYLKEETKISSCTVTKEDALR